MIYRLLMQAGKKVALLSTVEKRIGEDIADLALTTPLPDHLHMFLKMCVDREVEYVVLEVSAQSLSLHRLDDVDFDAASFTNFSHEHLEFYENLDEYFKAKTALIGKVKDLSHVFMNTDDDYGKTLIECNPGISTYSLQDTNATLFGKPAYKNHSLELAVMWNQKIIIHSLHLMGEFNAYNMLAAISRFCIRSFIAVRY